MIPLKLLKINEYIFLISLEKISIKIFNLKSKKLKTITNNINKILELLKTPDNDSLILKLENINNEIITNIYKKGIRINFLIPFFYFFNIFSQLLGVSSHIMPKLIPK